MLSQLKLHVVLARKLWVQNVQLENMKECALQEVITHYQLKYKYLNSIKIQ